MVETLCEGRFKGERNAINGERRVERMGILPRSRDCRPICLNINLELFFLGQPGSCDISSRFLICEDESGR